MKITFVRHGQTDFNKEGKTQGQEVDLPLNDAGIAQAEAVILPSPNIDLIISSPLKRASQTAEIINRKYNAPLLHMDDAKEFNYGTLSGKTWAEIEAETGDMDIHKKDITASYDYRPYGGESADEVRERVTRFLNEVKMNHSDKNVLIVTHGGIIEAMQSLFSSNEIVEAQNAQLYEFEI